MAEATTRAEIRNAIVAAIEGMSVAGGYSSDWGRCHTRIRSIQNAGALPAANLLDVSTAYSTATQAHTRRRWTFTIQAFDKVPDGDDDEAQRIADGLLADLERLLEADWTRGGHAFDTILSSSRVELGEAAGDLVVVEVTGIVDYRTPYAQPEG